MYTAEMHPRKFAPIMYQRLTLPRGRGSKPSTFHIGHDRLFVNDVSEIHVYSLSQALTKLGVPDARYTVIKSPNGLLSYDSETGAIVVESTGLISKLHPLRPSFTPHRPYTIPIPRHSDVIYHPFSKKCVVYGDAHTFTTSMVQLKSQKLQYAYGPISVHAAVVPSRYSEKLYTTVHPGDDLAVNVIDPIGTKYVIPYSGKIHPSIMAYRLDSPDVLTIADENHLNIIDPWRSSRSEIQQIPLADVGWIHQIEYIDYNVCTISADTQMCTVDMRYGRISNRVNFGAPTTIWCTAVDGRHAIFALTNLGCNVYM